MFPVFEKNIHVVQADETLTAYDVLVYRTLVDYVNHKTLTCYPSRATIAKAAHCSLRTVANAIKQLVERGHIEKITRKRERTNANTSNLYILPDLTQRQQKDKPDPMHHVHDVEQAASAPDGDPTKQDKPDPMHHVHDVEQAASAPDGDPTKQTNAGYTHHVQDIARASTVPANAQRVPRHKAPHAPKPYRSKRSIDRSIDVAVRERIDKHFEREFFAEQTEYFEMYQTFADYMGEMLTDPQTVISKVPIKRERLEELIFSANAGNLCDFLAHIHEIRPMLHIRAPKPYYKTAWIEWCRDLAAWRLIPSASRAAHGAPTKPNYDDLLEDLTA